MIYVLIAIGFARENTPETRADVLAEISLIEEMVQNRINLKNIESDTALISCLEKKHEVIISLKDTMGYLDEKYKVSDQSQKTEIAHQEKIGLILEGALKVEYATKICKKKESIGAVEILVLSTADDLPEPIFNDELEPLEISYFY